MNHDVIGTIYETQPVYDEEGNVVTEGVLAEGFHVNFPSPVPEFEEYRVYPATPIRVYAGGVTPACYTFADEAEWEVKKEEVFGNPNEVEGNV